MSSNRSIKTARALDAIEKILIELKTPMTCPELAHRLNISERDCRYYVQYLRETKKIHVSGWTYINGNKPLRRRDMYSLRASQEIEIEKPKKINIKNCFLKVPGGKRQAHCDIAASWIPRK